MRLNICLGAFCGLLLTLALEQFTNLDVLISNYFYDSITRSWAITYEQHINLSPIFYNGMKAFVSAVGALAVISIAASIKYDFLKPYRQGALIVVLSTIIIPSCVSFLKDMTQIYCPNQLTLYNGLAPYIHVFGSYPGWFHSIHQPRCFPAGHPTGAFALMSLSFVFVTPRAKYCGLIFGFIAGLLASGYQMLRGEHFLSHCLTSFFLAVLLILFIQKLVFYAKTEFLPRFPMNFSAKLLQSKRAG